MNRRTVFATSVTSIAATAAMLGAVSAQTLTLGPNELARLDAREVVINVNPDDGNADGRVEAAIDVAAPPAAVWLVLLDCDRAPSFMPALKSCTVLAKSPDDTWDVREHRVSWAGFLPEARSVFRSEYTKEASIRFSRIEGDLTSLDGEWRLERLDGVGRTRLHYRARIGTGLPLPAFLIRKALERDVPNFLKALRAEMER